MKKNQNTGIRCPRIYTIHSQKGGVGKTSIAIAIAGLAAILHGKKSLIIDADLTGVSLADVFLESGDKPLKYFNELILAKPIDFGNYTQSIFKGKKDSQIEPFCQEYREFENMYYMPGSPILSDIMQIIPLLSQESHLDFFKHRLEDIIITAIVNGFEVIVIDLPPGLLGLSRASLKIVIEQVVNRIKKEKNFDSPPTRLDGLYNILRRESENKGIETQAILVTTPDPCDYKSLVPSFQWLLNKSEIDKKEKSDKNFIAYSEIIGEIDMFLNKAKSSSTSIFDAVIETGKVFDDIKQFPDSRRVDDELIDALKERAKTIGATGEYIEEFKMKNILYTIKRLKGQETKKHSRMEGWCWQVGQATNL